MKLLGGETKLRSELGLSGSEAHLSVDLFNTNFVVNLFVTELLCSLPALSLSLS